jgi:hypothetical protein
LKVLVLFAQFTDDPPGGPNTRLSLEDYFDNMLFGTFYDPPEYNAYPDHPPNNTLKNYFMENSYGAVDVVTLDMPSDHFKPHLDVFYHDDDHHDHNDYDHNHDHYYDYDNPADYDDHSAGYDNYDHHYDYDAASEPADHDDHDYVADYYLIIDHHDVEHDDLARRTGTRAWFSRLQTFQATGMLLQGSLCQALE